MATIRKKGKKSVPAVSTASLPDIIFMLLFFFMVATSMKEVTYKVDMKYPEATELKKLEKKSLVRYIYVGNPKKEFVGSYGSETRIQLDDQFRDVSDLAQFITSEREGMNANDQDGLVVSIKADKETRMGLVTDIKQALRSAYALKISYAATKRKNVY